MIDAAFRERGRQPHASTEERTPRRWFCRERTGCFVLLLWRLGNRQILRKLSVYELRLRSEQSDRPRLGPISLHLRVNSYRFCARDRSVVRVMSGSSATGLFSLLKELIAGCMLAHAGITQAESYNGQEAS